MKTQSTRTLELLTPVIAATIGTSTCVVIVLLISQDAASSLKCLFLGPLSSASRIGNVLEEAIPLILCGIAVAIPFKAQQFYVGTEGVVFISAAVGTAFGISTAMPKAVHIPLLLLVAAFVGAIWGLIPALLKTKWNANILVSSLMLNYITYFCGLYLINYFFRDQASGFFASYVLPKTAWLEHLIPGTRIYLGTFVAILLAVLTHFFLYNTVYGYEIRMTGHNVSFAGYVGIDVNRSIVVSVVASGFLAGLAGMLVVMGIHRRFLWTDTTHYGWDGVVVALIARENPILVILVALFISYIRIGGQVMNLLSDVPYEIVRVLEALIILFVTAEAFLKKLRAAV